MTTTVDTYHVPVLLKESVDGLRVKPDGVYVDVTFGGGGHSREILSRLGDGGRLFGFDQDADAEANIPHDPRFTFVRSNFRYLDNWMRYHGVEHIDGLIADLGVSSHHFDDAERGFSFRFDAPLDMRMNKRDGRTAADVLNKYDEARLADVFYLYGELRQSRKLASAVVKARAAKPIVTTQDLLDATSALFRKERTSSYLVTGTIFFYFYFIWLAVITYHSLEDRMVKNVIRTGNAEGTAEQDFFGRVSAPFAAVNNKVVTPGEAELEANPRSRSAKLRIAERREYTE